MPLNVWAITGYALQLFVPIGPPVRQHRDCSGSNYNLVCGCITQPFLANNQSAPQDKLGYFWALAWSNQVRITSPVSTFFFAFFFLLCVTFTMSCSSFLITKTHCPSLFKQRSKKQVTCTLNGMCECLEPVSRVLYWYTFFPFFPCVECLSMFLASRYDESSSYPYLRAGWTHRTSQGQRQPQTLPGIWGGWANDSNVKVALQCWFLSNCVFIEGKKGQSHLVCSSVACFFFWILSFLLVLRMCVL